VLLQRRQGEFGCHVEEHLEVHDGERRGRGAVVATRIDRRVKGPPVRGGGLSEPRAVDARDRKFDGLEPDLVAYIHLESVRRRVAEPYALARPPVGDDRHIIENVGLRQQTHLGVAGVRRDVLRRAEERQFPVTEMGDLSQPLSQGFVARPERRVARVRQVGAVDLHERYARSVRAHVVDRVLHGVARGGG
jgi:hypothetical protein